MWWLYFDRSADEGARIIAGSDDPGRLGRSAYHFIHPVMVAGIIVSAAADEVTLAGPGAVGHAPASWMILGGVGLFLAGHAAFKVIIWRQVPWTRLAAVVILALLGLAAPHLSALALGACAAAVVIVVAATDYTGHRGDEYGEGGVGGEGESTGRAEWAGARTARPERPGWDEAARARPGPVRASHPISAAG